jgi:hypothetical protein
MIEGSTMKKPPPVTRDERVTLADAVHQLKELHGPRVTAHLLYHQARALTLEADRAAVLETEANEKQRGVNLLLCCVPLPHVDGRLPATSLL